MPCRSTCCPNQSRPTRLTSEQFVLEARVGAGLESLALPPFSTTNFIRRATKATWCCSSVNVLIGVDELCPKLCPNS